MTTSTPNNAAGASLFGEAAQPASGENPWTAWASRIEARLAKTVGRADLDALAQAVGLEFADLRAEVKRERDADRQSITHLETLVEGQRQRIENLKTEIAVLRTEATVAKQFCEVSSRLDKIEASRAPHPLRTVS